MDTGPEQRFIGVDVSHAGDVALIEHERLDRDSAAAREPAEVLGREFRVERLDPEPQR